MKQLPMIKHKGRWYYVDARLWEIRNTRTAMSFDIDDLTNDDLVKNIIAVIPNEELIKHY
jgi:hypothetical protein